MVQLSDLHAVLSGCPHLDRHGLQHPGFDLDPITDADFPAFELAVDFISPFWSGSLAQLSQPLPSSNTARGLTPGMLASRAERFAELCGLPFSVSIGVMIAALAHYGSSLPFSYYPAGVGCFFSPPLILAALNCHRDGLEIMRASPEPLTPEEAKVLAILAVHGIDAPDGVKRLFIAPRPTQIACVFSPPGSRWLHSQTILPIGRAKKLGLEYLLEPTG